MAMEGKSSEKGKFYDESGKRHQKNQEMVQDQSLTMAKSWVMTNIQTSKKHEE